MLVDNGELARKIRLHVKILERGFDTGRHADDVADRCGWCDGNAIAVTHAMFANPFAQAIPIQGAGAIDLQIPPTLLRQKIKRVLGEDSTIPQGAPIAGVAAALRSEIGAGPVRVVADGFHRTVCELDRCGACVRDTQQVQTVLKPHDAQADRAMLQVGMTSFGDGVVVDIDDVIEHAHRGLDGSAQFVMIQCIARAAVSIHSNLVQMREQIDRPEIAHGDFSRAGIECDLGAEVAGMHHPDMLLR